MPRQVDGSDDGTARCDIGATEWCGPDTDSDGRGDGCDCAPLDATVHQVPPETVLAVAREGASTARLEWLDVSAVTGSAVAYDIASELLSVLHAERTVEAPCLRVGLVDTTDTDDRPVSRDGYYYLVRAANACVATGEGWGSGSLGLPRTACP